MTELLDLCYDVLICVLEEIDPSDLAACAQTSVGFNEFLKKNTRLYKAHYLKTFDDPRQRPDDPEPDWVVELQRAIRCQKILGSGSNDVKRDEFEFVTKTVLSLVATASTDKLGVSNNQQLLSNLFESITQNRDAFMSRSSLYARAGTVHQKPAKDEEGRQLSAKLQCLFGITSTTSGRRSLQTHPYARSMVYDLRKYTDENEWGPFRDDGSMRVDWEMLESIMIVLGYSSNLCCRRFLSRFRPPWTHPFEGVIPERASMLPPYPTALPREINVPLRLKDPYNVTGVWSRIVCFLDYNDLYHFNFGEEAVRWPSDQPRDPTAREEAIRHIMMDIKVTSVEAAGASDQPGMPVVHFSGKSRSVEASWDPNANSGIRGSVRVTPEGEVRWQTISVFHGGEERWRSDGIQVGGLRAQRGVIGTWFDKDFDAHGPAGPTAFWKISDQNLVEDEDDF
ncbi:uncharacterized protein M421DRAFT_104945 [Didymella exigua CBS 183.55]|uniref:F-box domain-containing protein n=1 Tax=Didymella exigua CBS 183.55 TaxID=1150837 RepID=A0A6A5R5Z3_9PLEO|nr:uncharacterized protein M421DRAFT_104945 [Didymella exigua CBS 183.55]KAF1922598.1 hypothetical protein M421DRAFT_104945 [Didymella exigua CBS 183.55]